MFAFRQKGRGREMEEEPCSVVLWASLSGSLEERKAHPGVFLRMELFVLSTWRLC